MKYLFSLLVIGVITAGQLDPANYQHLRQDRFNIDLSVPVKDSVAAKQLGALYFNLPGTAFGSCASCHDTKNAGQPLVKFPSGGRGEHDRLYKKHDPNFNADIPGVNSRSIANTVHHTNLLNGAKLGCDDLNEGIAIEKLQKVVSTNIPGNHPLKIQFDIASSDKAHNISNYVFLTRSDHVYRDLAKKAFGTTNIDRNIVESSLVWFEATFNTTESNFQKWLRGESELKHEKGVQLILEKCEGCHSGPALGGTKLAKSIDPFDDRFKFTGDVDDTDMMKVPSLFNLLNAPAHGLYYQFNTPYQAIKAHTDITPQENRSINKALRADFTDKEMDRHTEVK